MDSLGPLQQARKNKEAAEKLANDLKQVLEQSATGNDCPPVSYGTMKATLGQPSQCSSTMTSDAAPEDTLQQMGIDLQDEADDMDLLRKRMLQQLEVERDMRGCVEAVLSKERAHSRKLQQLLNDAQLEVRDLSRVSCLTPDEAHAIKSAHEAAVGKERADAALAVREIKSISERALLEHSAAWGTERSKLNEDICTLREASDRELDELHNQVAILKGALHASQKDAEAATARSRAQVRVLLRKVKTSASFHVNAEFLELTKERASLMDKNTMLAARVSELEKLEARVRRQLANERCARQSAEGQTKASQAAQRNMETTCDRAASEICILRNEVERVRTMMHKQAETGGEKQSVNHAKIQELSGQVQQAQQICQGVMVRILNMLDPERIALLAQLPACEEGSVVQHALLDVEYFRILKMKLRSTPHPAEVDTYQVLSWLDEVLQRGVQALQQAQDSQAAAIREAAEARAEAVRSSLEAQADIQAHQRTILCLHVDVKERDVELADARTRLEQAAASAENLAGTLAEQEWEILRLQEALKQEQQKDELLQFQHEGYASELVQVEYKNSQRLDKIGSDYGKNMQSEASAQTDLETESEMQNDLKVCKAQLESRDCRIQELRQALNKSCARHDQHALHGKLQASEEELHAVNQQLRAVQDDANRWQAECRALSKQIASLSDQLQNDITIARCSLQKVQRPGAVMDSSEFRRFELNATHAIANLSAQDDPIHEAGALTRAATGAICALAAALEVEYHRALRSEWHSKEVEQNIKGLHIALCRAQAVITGNRSSTGQSVTETGAARDIAAMFPVVQLMAQGATELQEKFCQCSCSLITTREHANHLTEELQESRKEVARLQQHHTLQLQNFHQSLQTVKSDTEAAKHTSHHKSEAELTQYKDAVVVAQELLVIRTEELQLCQTNLDSCAKELKAVKLELETVQQDSGASQRLACTLQTELSVTHQKMEELQVQLEKSRAATARARLSRSQPCERLLCQKGNDRNDTTVPAAASINSPEAVDTSALIQQLGVTHKRLNKTTKEKAEMKSELKHLQARFEKLEVVHTKVCERRASADVSNKKLCGQVEALQADLRQAVKVKEDQQMQLGKLAGQLNDATQSAEHAARNHKEWISQLSNAERTAQDSRCAAVRSQARCAELTHALTEVQAEVETARQERVAAQTSMAETYEELSTVREALKACEAALQAARRHNMECSETENFLQQMGNSMQTDLSLRPENDHQQVPVSLLESDDAKSIRIQQLRETLISLSSEKADLTDAVGACRVRIAQMEAERVNQHQGATFSTAAMNYVESRSMESATDRRMDELVCVKLKELDLSPKGQQEAEQLAVLLKHRNFDLQELLTCNMCDYNDTADFVRSLESTSESLFQELKKLKIQSTAEVNTLQQQLLCTHHGEETERKEKERLQGHVEKSVAEAEQLQRDSVRKGALLLQSQSDLAKLQLERIEENAKMGALSKSVDDARTDAQNAILRAAAKEDDLEKSKNTLNVIEADLSAYKRRFHATELLKSQLQDRLVNVSGECDILKERNRALASEIQELQSELKVSKALELQLRSDLAKEQNRADTLAQSCISQTSMLEKKTAEVARLLAKLTVAEDRLDKLNVKFHDARLHIAIIQKDRARAQEQSAADFKALVDARKENVSFKKKISELEERMRKQAPRSKGKTLADVYRGGTMRRDNGHAIEEAAAQAIETVEAEIQAKEAYAASEAAFIQEIEMKTLEIIDLKQQLAGITEELAAAADSDVHIFSGQAARGDGAETGRMPPCLPRTTCQQDAAAAPGSLEDNKPPKKVLSSVEGDTISQEMTSVKSPQRSGVRDPDIMTRIEDDVGHESCHSLEGSHDEAPAAKDQSFEERLLLIELTEVQRELQYAKQGAEEAHAAAKAASTELQAQSESQQQEIDILRAKTVALTDALDAERSRANEAAQEFDVLQAELPYTSYTIKGNNSLGRLAKSGEADIDFDRSQAIEASAVQASDSAVWHALHAAQNDAAKATARAAEAQAFANSYQNQLHQAREEQINLLREMASAVGIGVDDDMREPSPVSVITRAHKISADVDCLRGEIEIVQGLLRDEQMTSLQIREDLLREKRASEAAIASVSAKQRELEQWRSQSAVSLASDSVVAPDHDHALVLSQLNAQETTPASLDEQGTDVAEIVSKWRFMSMTQFSEANGLADQLAVERKALQNMRAQALMLERQVETAEDQLDSERSSAAARECSMRTQLGNLEAQLAEQERLLLLKTSSLAVAEAHAESFSAELISAKERARALEDMVKSAEGELQSAIHQMSDMQTMVVSTDAKLLDAQDAMADRDNALPRLKRLLESLSSICGQESANLEAWSKQGAMTAMQEAERLMTAVKEIMSVQEASLDGHKLRCENFARQVAVLKSEAAQAHDDLAFQRSTAIEQQSTISEMCKERDTLTAQLVQKSKQIEEVEKKSQKLSEVARTQADQLRECEATLVGLRAELDVVAADSQHANGQLAARFEEVTSVRSQLKAADELNLKLKSRLRDLDREMATCRSHAEAAAESHAASHQEADMARGKLQSVSGRLDESETRLNSLQLALEKKNQEVRELNSMLKAWEAMRLSKDAQIAALMERCKRYDEDIAEKGRSNEALRRKLMHHHGSGSTRGSSHALNDHVRTQETMAGSVAGSLSGSDGGRMRHIHLHMHGAGRAPGTSSASTPTFYQLSQQRRE